MEERLLSLSYRFAGLWLIQKVGGSTPSTGIGRVLPTWLGHKPFRKELSVVVVQILAPMIQVRDRPLSLVRQWDEPIP